MPNDQFELFHHHLLRTLHSEGFRGNRAFLEYCIVNALDPSADCLEIWRARQVIWAWSG